MIINIGLSPNLTPQDSWLALKMLFQPWEWKSGPGIKQLEDWFKTNMSDKTDSQSIEAVSFNSGRSAEYSLFKAFGLKQGDEVLLQAFTCVAVPNSVLWRGATPVYVDIDESLTMDPFDLEKKINSNSKMIIIQHTFGQLANLEKIFQIAKKHNLFVIEDCAHLIKKNIQGDAAFFSFGRDKAVSSIFGGMAVTNDPLKSKQLSMVNSQLNYPSYWWIFQQLLHPVAMAVILPLYNWANLGKLILFGLQKLKLLSLPVAKEEKEGKQPKGFPAKMPNVLAVLALAQLGKLEEFEERRREIVEIYQKELKSLDSGQARMTRRMLKLIQHDGGTAEITSLLRYSILVEKPDELRKFAKQKGVILGNWYANIIDPKGVDFKKVGYRLGSCPVAEKTARQIVNLPTYPRMKADDVFRVIRVIREFFHD